MGVPPFSWGTAPPDTERGSTVGSTTAILTATALIAWGGCGWEIKEKKENEQGISPLFVRVNCTWSQNQRELFLAIPVAHFRIWGCLPSGPRSWRTSETLRAGSVAHGILLFLPKPPATIYFSESSDRLFRFYSCIHVFTPFHPELDPRLFP